MAFIKYISGILRIIIQAIITYTNEGRKYKILIPLIITLVKATKASIMVKNKLDDWLISCIPLWIILFLSGSSKTGTPKVL
jgi:hypothetical protein